MVHSDAHMGRTDRHDGGHATRAARALGIGASALLAVWLLPACSSGPIDGLTGAGGSGGTDTSGSWAATTGSWAATSGSGAATSGSGGMGAGTTSSSAGTSGAGGGQSNGMGGDTTPGSHSYSGTFGPRPGSYTVYVPSGLKNPAPLLFGLHGTSGTGAQQNGYEKSIADTHGFLLAAPDAGKSQWCINPQSGSSYYACMKDDVDYVTAVLTDVLAKYNVDTHRIWAAGFSQGAFFVYWAALTFHQDVYAGYVACAGRIPAWGQANEFSAQNTAPGIPGLIVHGQNDPYVPFSDGQYSYNTLLAAGHDVTPLWHSGDHLWPQTLNTQIADWLVAHTK